MKLELSIGPNYAEWDRWQCIRDLMQNAKDADDLGFSMETSYDPTLKILKIKNHRAKLDRSSLVLGMTSKKDDPNQRGKYGEGYKIALASLLRLGCVVTIINKNEIWKPLLEKSSHFETEVLSIEINPNPAEANCVEFIVVGIEPNEWEQAQTKLLFCQPPSLSIQTRFGTIIIDDNKKNKIYAQGIYVGESADKLSFSYDLKALVLDRDRQIPNPYSLRGEIRAVWANAYAEKKVPLADIFGMLSADCGESLAFKDDSYSSKELGEALLGEFISRYGTEAVPVATTGEQLELANIGLNAIVLSSGLSALINRASGGEFVLRQAKAQKIMKAYTKEDLTEAEIANATWAYNLVNPVQKVERLSVVDFKSNKIFGIYEKGCVVLSRKILLDKKELLSTMVHEVAHKFGRDGDPLHREAIERIFSTIVLSLQEGK